MEFSRLISIALDSLPDLLSLHQQNRAYYPHLLASNRLENSVFSEQSKQGRYDILFAAPQQVLSLYGQQLYIDDELIAGESDFLKHLDKLWSVEKNPSNIQIDSEQPFTGGWFLYLSYELAQQIEPSLQLAETDDHLPAALACRFPAAIIIDHKTQTAQIICEAAFAAEAEKIKADCQIEFNPFELKHLNIGELREDAADLYYQQFDRLKQYIIDGDVFQVNLSRAWRTQLLSPCTDAHLFKHLSKANPGPFNALMTLGEQAVISTSPERLIEVRNGQVQTRPIAGTRPRAKNITDDQYLSTELLASPKEQAEHIMLIDLERNDLGRICQAGTVEVNELMVLESYSQVHHIVSNVRGELREDISPGDVIRAVFPGGTITGCPKVRCMEILAELEQVGRSAYTGSLGYLNHDGSMDLNILIRSLIRDGDQLKFRAGGGIVIDSKVEHELQETRAKAKALIVALKTDH